MKKAALAAEFLWAAIMLIAAILFLATPFTMASERPDFGAIVLVAMIMSFMFAWPGIKSLAAVRERWRDIKSPEPEVGTPVRLRMQNAGRSNS